MGFKNLTVKTSIGLLAGIVGAIVLVLVIAMCLAPELFVIFLVLKLVDAIAFSWFLVFLPLIVFVGCIIIYTVIVCIYSVDKQ